MEKNIEQPKAMKIVEVRCEAKDICTFKFNEKLKAEPGQFVMLWLPRINQKPFGISKLSEDSFELTICKVGSFTDELFKKNPGDYVGIQGPYGKPFSLEAKNAVLVAGGYGSAPIAFLADALISKGAKVTLIIGAKNKESLVFENRFKDSNATLICTTDDGSLGRKGFTTDALKDVLENDKTVDMIYTCGPEIMMKKVIELADTYNVNCQASLERYMKCGFGICGQCCVDDTGVRICKEGPVFDKEFIKKYVLEFGKYHRDGTGKKLS